MEEDVLPWIQKMYDAGTQDQKENRQTKLQRYIDKKTDYEDSDIEEEKLEFTFERYEKERKKKQKEWTKEQNLRKTNENENQTDDENDDFEWTENTEFFELLKIPEISKKQNQIRDYEEEENIHERRDSDNWPERIYLRSEVRKNPKYLEDQKKKTIYNF